MRHFIALSSLALFAAVPAANAATTTNTFAVTATVNANCLVSATTLAFGTYIPSATATVLDATSTVSVNCTRGTTFNVGLDAGTSSGATVASRAMTSGSNLLPYQLYSNSGRTTVWGNTVGTDTVSGTGAGMGTPQVQSLTVYGRIPDTPTAAPGGYTDTVTVTVTY